MSEKSEEKRGSVNSLRNLQKSQLEKLMENPVRLHEFTAQQQDQHSQCMFNNMGLLWLFNPTS